MDTTITPKVIEDGSLEMGKFVWNDDCPAWPVRLTTDVPLDGLTAQAPGQAWVTAPVLLAMVKAVATNTIMGHPFVDDEDAVLTVEAITTVDKAWYEGRLVYDVSGYVINTGSMERDTVEAAGYEAIGETDAVTFIYPGTPEWDESERALEVQRRHGG